MAEWTLLAIGVGMFGVLVSGVGLGFLYWNVRLMRKQISETRTLGQKQIKAYLTCRDVECRLYQLKTEDREREWIAHFWFTVKNTGQSPARLPGVSVVGLIIDNNGEEEIQSINFESKTIGIEDVAAGGAEPTSILAKFRDYEKVEKILDVGSPLSGKCVIVVVFLSGLDVFGNVLDDESIQFWTGANGFDVPLKEDFKLRRSDMQSEWGGHKLERYLKRAGSQKL
jgi:hypothetical protein